jgi:Tol biopolymer transport system component
MFSSNRNSQLDLYERSIGEMDEKLRFADAQRKVAESWIMGKVLFVSSRTGLFTVAAPGDTAPQAVRETELQGDEYHVSPDGRWVAYNTQESGTWQVYVAAFPPFRQRRQVSTSGGGQALWNKNGTEIYYLSSQGDMMAAEIKTSPALEPGIPRKLFQTRVRQPNFQHDQYGVTPDGSRFLVIEPAQEPDESINVLVNWQAALMPGRRAVREQ